MHRILFIYMIMLVNLWADSTDKPVLFGKIINVNENDVLNVRVEPDYRSEKIAEIYASGYLGVDECRIIGKSTWCKTHALVQHGEAYENGWVNARYLSFRDKGYVTIKGEKNSCFYALKCKNKVVITQCLVATNYTTDAQSNIKELKTKWFDRALLRGESQFGAASSDMEGYCITDKWIEDYLQRYPDFLK